MAHEITLLIGKDTGQIFEGYTFFNVETAMNLGKNSRSRIRNLDIVNHTPAVSKWEFNTLVLGDCIDEPVSEDRYGIKPKPVPITNIIAALKQDVSYDGYRPAIRALALLEKIEETKISDEHYSILIYGH